MKGLWGGTLSMWLPCLASVTNSNKFIGSYKKKLDSFRRYCSSAEYLEYHLVIGLYKIIFIEHKLILKMNHIFTHFSKSYTFYELGYIYNF